VSDRYLSAYYFMSTDLCMNRAHIREDMQWLKDHAFDAIHIACHEEHYRQPIGMRWIIDEAHAAGIKVFAIPSRWCGLIAGWPVLAGHFAASRPDTWMVKEDGSPMIKNFCGPLCSVHHPDVQAHMISCVETMLETFDFDGITWDELKTLHETDYHPLAIEKYGHPVSGTEQVQATLDIFAACNRRAREIKPDLRIVSFLYAFLSDDLIDAWAATEGFDDVGPDGHVASAGDPGKHNTKFLIDDQERFNKAAARHGRRSFALIETQGATVANAETTMKRLPEYLTMAPDHIAVYYKPLVDEDGAEITDQIGPVLRDWRLGKS
jgi:hypothetical protein